MDLTASRAHASALRPFSTCSSLTPATTATRPLASSTEIIRTLPAGKILRMAVKTLVRSLPSPPSSSAVTINGRPSFAAAWACASPSAEAAATASALAFKLSFLIFSDNLPSSFRISSFTSTLIDDPSTSFTSSATSFSSSAPATSEPANVSTFFSNISPILNASLAASPVTPMMRLTPFATALSSTMQNAPASAVLVRCVPPHSSMESPPHAAAVGSARRSSTGAPTETTRTGSG
mmetsp:Transcript_16605/g.42810  ORF Transcript_16605/g.42810 Transcript_16605/m.42810 type:complete len:236 (-) Transcript_16605:1181-1888(-)